MNNYGNLRIRCERITFVGPGTMSGSIFISSGFPWSSPKRWRF
nr:MAG TPA: hypothetical protein [Caudoviricetes sp.]